MQIRSFLKPVNKEKAQFLEGFLGNQIDFNIENADLKSYSLAILGVPEDRNSIGNKGCDKGADEFREYFYQLTTVHSNLQIIDLGNLIPGKTVDDTYIGLAIVLAELLENKVVPIIIGGSQDLTLANFKAYEKLEQVINVVTIDPSFDIGDVGEPITSNGYVNKIILHQPSYLFNFSNLGYQSYFVTQEERNLMDKLHFDCTRLGEIKADLKEAEPIIRNADLVSFDLSAIRNSDAPANKNVTPNGFYGEDACALARYAGISDKVSSIGFYEFNPLVKDFGQTAFLLAQMVWYFIEGFGHRKGEIPEINKNNYLKYRVNSDKNERELIFLKNVKTDRWWMDIPHPKNDVLKFKRHQMVPCSYSDYVLACNDEMPERWIKTFQKLI
tara:strand:- start:5350 stop:6504 length:1155 start_codon:yes stop_codon:yes gene_type:complete